MLACQKHLFQIPDDVTYLNCAYMSPLMKSVVEAGKVGLDRKTRPWEIFPKDFFILAEEFRQTGARLFGCSTDCVAIIPSASYGIMTAAQNLRFRKGQTILLLEEQFPSNYYVWRRLAYEKGATVRTVPFPTDGDWTNRVLEFLTSEVAVAALPNVHWTNGGQLDLLRIAKALRSNGGALILDLTQSLGVLPFSVCDVQPDFAVAACYKWLLGPYGVAILYVAPNWHSGQPLEENWIQRANAHDFASLMVYTEEYEQGARRFDMGERSNFALLPAATAGVEQLLKWNVTEISDSLSVLTRLLCSSAADIGFASLPENLRAPHYACLSRKQGIRKHLLEALTDRKIFVSIRGNSLRVTPHIYNSADDIHILCSCLQRIVNSRTETPS